MAMAGVLERFRIDGKVALVTGGSRGLGRAIAEALATAGARVAISARQLQSARRAADEVAAASGQTAMGLAADVTVRSDVEAMVGRILEGFGRLDILVNNAGINIRGPIEQLSEADWDAVVDTNLKGPWLCCRAVAEPMKAQRWGRVINVSSMLGEIALPGRSPYAASKGGLTLLTKTLALEWAPHGINVNALCPGPFATEINTPLLNDPAARAQMEANVPLARWGDPAELGPAAVFLASDASSFMTGATLFIDGGYTAR
jgi:NAD(P)-dependent dehydrogenase (short-subunit alcohol dehydrogenase family)